MLDIKNVIACHVTLRYVVIMPGNFVIGSGARFPRTVNVLNLKTFPPVRSIKLRNTQRTPIMKV